MYFIFNKYISKMFSGGKKLKLKGGFKKEIGELLESCTKQNILLYRRMFCFVQKN